MQIIQNKPVRSVLFLAAAVALSGGNLKATSYIDISNGKQQSQPPWQVYYETLEDFKCHQDDFKKIEQLLERAKARISSNPRGQKAGYLAAFLRGLSNSIQEECSPAVYQACLAHRFPEVTSSDSNEKVKENDPVYEAFGFKLKHAPGKTEKKKSHTKKSYVTHQEDKVKKFSQTALNCLKQEALKPKPTIQPTSTPHVKFESGQGAMWEVRGPGYR